eukprot:753281-Hanusia_phi.AAC.3
MAQVGAGDRVGTGREPVEAETMVRPCDELVPVLGRGGGVVHERQRVYPADPLHLPPDPARPLAPPPAAQPVHLRDGEGRRERVCLYPPVEQLIDGPAVRLHRLSGWIQRAVLVALGQEDGHSAVATPCGKKRFARAESHHRDGLGERRQLDGTLILVLEQQRLRLPARNIRGNEEEEEEEEGQGEGATRRRGGAGAGAGAGAGKMVSYQIMLGMLSNWREKSKIQILPSSNPTARCSPSGLKQTAVGGEACSSWLSMTIRGGALLLPILQTLSVLSAPTVAKMFLVGWTSMPKMLPFE